LFLIVKKLLTHPLTLLEFTDIPEQSPINLLLHNTANTVEWTVIRVVKGYVSGMIKFTDFFLSHVAFVLFPQVMQQQTSDELGISMAI